MYIYGEDGKNGHFLSLFLNKFKIRNLIKILYPLKSSIFLLENYWIFLLEEKLSPDWTENSLLKRYSKVSRHDVYVK